MPVTCTADNLATLAACFVGLSPAQKEAVKIYLLAVQAGVDPDAEELAILAKCLEGLMPTQQAAIQTYLLCQIANGGSGPCSNLEGASSPLNVVTPDFIGQVYVQSDGTIWQAGSLLSSSWTSICTPGDLSWGPAPEGPVDSIDVSLFNQSFFTGDTYTELTFHNPTEVTNSIVFNNDGDLEHVRFTALVSVEAIDSNACPALISLRYDSLTSVATNFDSNSCPALESIFLGLLETIGLGLVLYDNDVLTSIDLSSLVSVGDTIDIGGCFSLTSLNLPALTTAAAGISATGCSSLATFSAPNFLPTNGTGVEFDGCALDAASVNHILARCVAAAVTTCSIKTNGGTNAAPTGQGIVDKAALILAGNAVTTN